MQEEKKAAAPEPRKNRRRRRKKNPAGQPQGAAAVQPAVPETPDAPGKTAETAESAEAEEKSAADVQPKPAEETVEAPEPPETGTETAVPPEEAPEPEAETAPAAEPAGAAESAEVAEETAADAQPESAGEMSKMPENPETGTETAVPPEEAPAPEAETAPAAEPAGAAESAETAEGPAADAQPQPVEETAETTKSAKAAEEPAADAQPGPAGETSETVESAEAEERSTADGQPEKTPSPEEPPAGGPDGEEEEAPSEEEEKRISDMTRTVQLSIEQIMAQVGEEETSGEEDPAEMPAPEDAGPQKLVAGLQKGLSGIAKWLLLVLFFVLVISGCGVAWLYGNATPDMLPQIEVTFDGQTVEPTAYKWKVPVIGNLFKRTYADTLSSTPVALEETVDQVSPDLTVSPAGYRDELTVTDSAGTVVYEGDTEDFAAFRFTANGTYTAKLVVYGDASKVPGDTSVTGSETWQFTFTVGVQPSIHLSAVRAEQGSAVAIRVGETLDGQPPELTTTLENPGFFRSGNNWVCYIPIPWNAPAGTEELTVEAGGYTQTYELEIRAAGWEAKDYYSDSQLTTPYIGAQDLPASVQSALKTSGDTVEWSNGNFVQPFLNSLDVRLAYGTTEYVGRSYSERSRNTGAGGRTATNAVLNTRSGEPLIAPANGTVLLAEDLGGSLGYTVVIDHGAGVKSLFFNLRDVSVKKGAALKQGQVIATCGRTTVAEMRIGTVPIDPVPVWRGQCDALKYY